MLRSPRIAAFLVATTTGLLGANFAAAHDRGWDRYGRHDHDRHLTHPPRLDRGIDPRVLMVPRDYYVLPPPPPVYYQDYRYYGPPPTYYGPTAPLCFEIRKKDYTIHYCP
ncbi:MAG TPA: hypothetical protein PKI93_06870 [Alphaproteobacteria bacterium]|nr:hypothetical protein [Alphaproteobacteria bacterium]HNS44292.1 hypothetical protein [Alphaproteobacteria bacterium]